MMMMYLGVVHDTPVFVRVAFVISTCNQCDEEKKKGAYNERARDHNFSRSNGLSGERKGFGGKFGKCRGIKRENVVLNYNLVIFKHILDFFQISLKK